MILADGILLKNKQIHSAIDEEFIKLSQDSPSHIQEVVSYILKSKGKRVRTNILFLAAGINNFGFSSLHKLAVAQELIHNASILHDDVIDNARYRRGKLSINEKFGNKYSILIGDWMFTNAMKIALEFQDLEVVKILTNQIKQLVEGELLQEHHLFNHDISRNEILKISSLKTGALFSGCFQLTFNGKSPLEIKSQVLLGNKIGLVFQVVDDLLDILGDDSLGKERIQDFTQGKITLPIYFAMKDSSEMKEFIYNSYEDRKLLERKEKFKKLFHCTNSRILTIEFLEKKVEEIKELLYYVENVTYKNALFLTLRSIMDRTY